MRDSDTGILPAHMRRAQAMIRMTKAEADAQSKKARESWDTQSIPSGPLVNPPKVTPNSSGSMPDKPTTPAQVRAGRAAKPSKMRNKRVQTPQGAFSSKREWVRYGELLLLAKAGDIRDLCRQVRFTLDVTKNGRTVHICDYVADFSYLDYTKYGDRCMRVEDVKPNFKTEASRKRYQATGPYRMFLLKKRLMLAIHGIDVREV